MGRKAGLTKEQNHALIRLEKNDFPYKEWVALVYAREWTYMRGEAFSDNIDKEFRIHYSYKEQARIKKLLRTMLFANYFGNWFYKRPWNRDKENIQICSIKQEE